MTVTNGSRVDARYCERVTRAHARTFYIASMLLPATKRRAAYAMYAFCRVADDLIDEAGALGVSEQRRQLATYRTALQQALDGNASGNVFREVARVVAHYGVPASPLFELLDGVERDLDCSTYADWPTLQRYCEGVASSVGEMCTHVFGVVDSPSALQRAVPYARTLGVAMQLTNILRDVGEDARRGRCYLPADELANFGFSTNEVLNNRFIANDLRWKQFMQHQVNRARTLYEVALPGIALLAPDTRRCAIACATGYAGILNAIESLDYDTISSRARLSRLARVGVLWGAWRGQQTSTAPDSIASPALPGLSPTTPGDVRYIQGYE